MTEPTSVKVCVWEIQPDGYHRTSCHEYWEPPYAVGKEPETCDNCKGLTVVCLAKDRAMYVMNDQPATCPTCGTRTDYVAETDIGEDHVWVEYCRSCNKRFRFVEPDPEDEKANEEEWNTLLKEDEI